MKFAIGPAATTAARFHTGCAKNETRFSSGFIAAMARRSGVLATLSSPWKRT